MADVSSGLIPEMNEHTVRPRPPSGPDLEALTKGAITPELLAAESAATGLTVEQIAQANLTIVWASAGRDASGFAARQMLRNAIADLDLARTARYDEDGMENKQFKNFKTDEGKERRKTWYAASSSARQNLAEARKHFVHATVFTQHVGNEEAARAKPVDPNTGEFLEVTAAAPGQPMGGVASRFAAIASSTQMSDSQRRAGQRDLKKLGQELLAAEQKADELSA